MAPTDQDWYWAPAAGPSGGSITGASGASAGSRCEHRAGPRHAGAKTFQWPPEPLPDGSDQHLTLVWPPTHLLHRPTIADARHVPRSVSCCQGPPCSALALWWSAHVIATGCSVPLHKTDGSVYLHSSLLLYRM
uniref:Uncharacterized protein n=1 Tax=Pipistrellus kuhlii TaxID=59472 RepID=A0A7J7VUZ5_PIPKU|nr:hypothetical protein mPipKuh1_008261 [Pipistrellus kuhlii]